MKVLNIHEREFKVYHEQVGILIDSLASEDERLWPNHSWHRIQFDRPLSIGADGGHGLIGYFVEQYNPGHTIKFRFTKPKGFNGFHGYWAHIIIVYLFIMSILCLMIRYENKKLLKMPKL